ncbi:MAG: hypothetical protein ABI451_12145 [Dokdonella sp.]
MISAIHAYIAPLALILLVVSVPATAAQSARSSANYAAATWNGPYPWNYQGTLPRLPQPALIAGACPSTIPTPRVLLAGDSWAQYMWDDNAHNKVFDEFGQADKLAVSRSLGSDPGPNYSGPEYAVSGSEARQWVNTASYPWIANAVAELNALPTIDTVMFSLGGNDILAAKSGGGFYKDMDLDVPGSQEALFARIEADSNTILQAFTALRPNLDVLVSSYEFPNFNVTAIFCGIYACPKRRDLSRDPTNALITDAEINAMNITVETNRIAWTNANPRLHFDNGDGEMHYYYGDGVAAPGVLPRPGQVAPNYAPFPGGNPVRPSLRENFRLTAGFISADPIHLNPAGYLYKVAVQTESTFFPKFRGDVSLTLQSLGGAFDGWTDGVATGTDSVRIGDDGTNLMHGIVTFDTSMIPADKVIESASLYLLQDTSSGTNPFVSGALGAPHLDVGQFGAPQVEIGDATAPADASDGGCFVGSASAKYYAIRIDLTPAAIAAIRRDRITQFRMEFSTVNPGVNRVQFSTGDAALTSGPELRQTIEYIDEPQSDGSVRKTAVAVTAVVHRGLAELLGSAKPFLDIRYADVVFKDGFEGTGAAVLQ